MLADSTLYQRKEQSKKKARLLGGVELRESKIDKLAVNYNYRRRRINVNEPKRPSNAADDGSGIAAATFAEKVSIESKLPML